MFGIGIHEEEIRTIKMQQSGGLLLTPVQTLVAPPICESPRVHQTKGPPLAVFLFGIGIHEEEIRTIKTQQSGGLLLTPVQTLVASPICESPRVHQ